MPTIQTIHEWREGLIQATIPTPWVNSRSMASSVTSSLTLAWITAESRLLVRIRAVLKVNNTKGGLIVEDRALNRHSRSRSQVKPTADLLWRGSSSLTLPVTVLKQERRCPRASINSVLLYWTIFETTLSASVIRSDLIRIGVAVNFWKVGLG